MRIRYSLLMLILGLLVLIPAVILAQENTPVCPTIVQESFTATEFLCESVADGEACIGNGVVSTTPKAGKEVTFANPGELANLADIQRLQLQSISTDNQAWTSVKAKLVTAASNGQPAVADFLIFGDVVLTEASQASANETPTASSVLPAVVQAGGGVIVRQDSRVDSNNIWPLQNGENVQAIGRSADNQWIRILIPGPNGGAGWVFSQFMNVEGGSELLPFVTNDSPIPEVSSTVSAPVDAPSYRFESLKTNTSCANTPDSGIILQSPSGTTAMIAITLNGVDIEFNGAVYITAQVNEKMTIYVVEGEASISSGDSTQAVPLANTSEITLNADLQAQGAPSAATPYSQATADLLVNLPIRLLSRNFEIRTSDGTTGAAVIPSTNEQQATPAPTEVPAVVEAPADCPSLVQESYTATEFVCEGLASNQACIGNGLVTAGAREGVLNFSFANPGDIVPVYDVQSVSAKVYETETNIWTSTILKVNIAPPTETPIDVTMLIMGELDLNNKGELPVVDATIPQEATPTAIPTEVAPVDTATDDTSGFAGTIEAPGVVTIRGDARVDSSSVGTIQTGDTVRALGRSVDQQWVQIRSVEGVVGWIFAQFVIVPEGLETLPIIDPATAASSSTSNLVQSAPPPPADASNTTVNTNGQVPYLPMQAFNFVSKNTDRDCDSHDSGILLQTPDSVTDNVPFLINNTEILFNGTLFVKAVADVNLNVTVLEGSAIVIAEEIAQTLQAGQQASVKFDQDFNTTEAPTLPGDYSAQRGRQYQGFPIRLLPRQFEVIVPEDDESSTTSTSSTDTDTSSTSPTNTDVASPGSCVISAGDQKRNIRKDAGTNFDEAYVMQPGETLVGISQKRGPDQFYWYETSKGWIRMDAGIMSPECESLPLYGVIYSGASAPAGGGEAGAPVFPTPIPPTAPPPPTLLSDGFGDICANGGLVVSSKDENSGSTYQEFGGVWTGTAGKSVTFSAEIPYFRRELVNILTFVNEDGSPWLGSIDKTSFTITFDGNRRFRVRVASLLGDTVTLRVNC